jgi:hypothetical protein
VALRRHYAAARPLVEALADLAGDATVPAPVMPRLPVDLDDMDGVGDQDRVPPEEEGRPSSPRESLVIISLLIVGAVLFAGLLGLAWAFRGTMAG